MKPFLFTIGSSPIPSFFFFIMVAALACTFFLYARARTFGLQPEAMLDMGILGIIVGILGSRVFHILVEAPAYYWAKPMRVFEFWRGGFVSWGAFIGLAIALPLFFRLRRLPVLVYFDFFATGAPLIKFFVRLACLLTGCCYGKPTDLPWAIHFSDPLSTAHYYMGNAGLHPTQIYSMIHATLLFFFMQWFYPRHRQYPGESICALSAGWALPRALIEFFRGDTDRGVYFGGHVSTGQITGLAITLVAVTLYAYLHAKYTRPSHPHAPAS